MYPTAFDEANITLDKPDGMTHEECCSINAFEGAVEFDRLHPVIITCWKPTKEELNEISRTGRVWCFMYSSQVPPHALSGHNPFDKPNNL